jgi:hypothetical protein
VQTQVKREKESALSRIVSVFLSIVVILLCVASPAWAVQSHNSSEGLAVHQIGHLLFGGGMAYLLFSLYRTKYKKYQWFEFKIFLVLIVVWNILTFLGHASSETIDKTQFIYLHGELVTFTINNFTDALFYLSNLDHLFLLPSFVFLLLALRKWEQQA